MFRKDCNHDQSKVKIMLKSHVKSSVKFDNMGYNFNNGNAEGEHS